MAAVPARSEPGRTTEGYTGLKPLSVDRGMSGQNTREPAAELGLLDATMIGMGAMIGAGIFVLTGW